MKTIGRIILAVILGFIVIVLTSAVIMSLPNIQQLQQDMPWLIGLVSHSGMLILSTLLLLIFGRGKLGAYGYRLPDSFSIISAIIIPLLLGVVTNIILSFMPESQSFAPGGYSFWDIVIFIWLYASICEEVYTRGLIQGMLKPLASKGFSLGSVHISLPMIVSAAYFSLMHLMAFATIAPVTLIFFLIAAFVLGLMAGYQVERTGSLIPAILVHAMFNISGSMVEGVWGLFG